MSFQGDIPSLSLGDIIQNLTNNLKTGVLAIRSPRGRHYVRFDTGRIVAYVDDVWFPPVDWLVRLDILPPGDKDEVLRLCSEGNRTLGQVLEERGLLDAPRYAATLRALIKEILYEVLCYRQGTFAFHSRDPEGMLDDRESRAVGLELNAVTVLMEAVKRSDDWQEIRKAVPDDLAVYVPVSGDPAALAREAGDDATRAAAALLDGTRTVEDLVGELPFSRFQVTKALASLVEDGKVRLLSMEHRGDSQPERSDGDAMLGDLETAFAKDPASRDTLTRLVDLCERLGKTEETARYSSLLADHHLASGNLRATETCLRKALLLDAKDTELWERLLEVLRRGGDKARILSAGRQFVGQLKKLGRLDVAREQLEALIRRYPRELDLRLDLADVGFQLGEREGTLDELDRLGHKLLRNEQFDDAERVFARIHKLDPGRREALDLSNEIRSGSLARRHTARRRFYRNVVLVALLTTLCFQLGYELHVHGKFFQAAKTVFAEGLLEKRQYAEARDRIERVRRRYPLSLTSLYKAPALIQAIAEGQSASERSPADDATGEGSSRGAAPEGDGAMGRPPSASGTLAR